MAKKLAEGGAPVPNIYMACGTEDELIHLNRDFSEYLTKIGIEHVYIESPGMHNWAFWDDCIEKALIWLDNMN